MQNSVLFYGRESQSKFGISWSMQVVRTQEYQWFCMEKWARPWRVWNCTYKGHLLEDGTKIAVKRVERGVIGNKVLGRILKLK